MIPCLTTVVLGQLVQCYRSLGQCVFAVTPTVCDVSVDGGGSVGLTECKNIAKTPGLEKCRPVGLVASLFDLSNMR